LSKKQHHIQTEAEILNEKVLDTEGVV
jgi:hypothetical protein